MCKLQLMRRLAATAGFLQLTSPTDHGQLQAQAPGESRQEKTLNQLRKMQVRVIEDRGRCITQCTDVPSSNVMADVTYVLLTAQRSYHNSR